MLSRRTQILAICRSAIQNFRQLSSPVARLLVTPRFFAGYCSSKLYSVKLSACLFWDAVVLCCVLYFLIVQSFLFLSIRHTQLVTWGMEERSVSQHSISLYKVPQNHLSMLASLSLIWAAPSSLSFPRGTPSPGTRSLPEAGCQLHVSTCWFPIHLKKWEDGLSYIHLRKFFHKLWAAV